MNRRTTLGLALALVLASLVALTGCPLKFEKEPPRNLPPYTFFERDVPDTTFINEVAFTWVGTDEDSDVVAYQYQLVSTDSLYYFTAGQEGEVIESLNPYFPADTLLWSDRDTDVFEAFRDLEDGWYEFRVRSIDAEGLVDPSPARDRFYVFFDDISPVCEITYPDFTRLNGQTSITFSFTVRDESRSSFTPRERLQYRYRLRAQSQTMCTAHLTDSPTEWEFFPPGADDDEITVGNQAPTLYNDLFDNDCEWEFKLDVRDPANNSSSCYWTIIQNGS